MRYHYKNLKILFRCMESVIFAAIRFIILVHYLRLETKNSSDSTKDLTGKQKAHGGGEVDPWLCNDLYLHPNFKKYF